MLALFQCRLNVCTRRLNTAHHLNHNVNAVIADNILPDIRQLFGRYPVRIFCLIPHQNLHNLQCRPNFKGHFLFLLFNDFIYATANSAHAQ